MEITNAKNCDLMQKSIKKCLQ